MRADTHDGPEQMLHLEAEYIVAALTFVDLKLIFYSTTRAVAAAFYDLEVGSAARGLFAEIHARNRPTDSFVVRT